MNPISIFITLIPTLLKIIGLVEVVYKQPKSGTAKKKAATEGAKAIVSGMVAASTGGQKETWELIEGPVSSVIDTAVALLYPKK